MNAFDTGIDLVALTTEDDYWAIHCKCFQESATIDKPAVDTSAHVQPHFFEQTIRNRQLRAPAVDFNNQQVGDVVRKIPNKGGVLWRTIKSFPLWACASI
jgi:predicted helicase